MCASPTQTPVGHLSPPMASGARPPSLGLPSDEVPSGKAPWHDHGKLAGRAPRWVLGLRLCPHGP